MKGLSLLLVVILASGCLGGTGDSSTTTTRSTTPRPPPTVADWTPIACDPGNATKTAVNVGLVDGLRGTEDSIARRIAEAMGDAVTGPAEPFEDTMYLRWPTRLGYVMLQTGDPITGAPAQGANASFLGGTYHRDSGALDTSAVFRAAEALGADPATLKSAGPPTNQVWQEWNGTRLYWQPIGVAGANVRADGGGSSVGIGPFYTFLADTPDVTTGEAMTAARAYLRCSFDSKGQTEAKGYSLNTTSILGIAVIRDTITHIVNIHHTTPRDSPCGKWDARWVFVDVTTGVVKHTMPGPCI